MLSEEVEAEGGQHADCEADEAFFCIAATLSCQHCDEENDGEDAYANCGVGE